MPISGSSTPQIVGRPSCKKCKVYHRMQQKEKKIFSSKCFSSYAAERKDDFFVKMKVCKGIGYDYDKVKFKLQK